MDPSSFCYVKRRTDALGGVKIRMGGANLHGYPEYGHVQDSVPMVLYGINVNLWRQFWGDVRSSERSNELAETILVLFLSGILVPTLFLTQNVILQIAIHMVCVVVVCCRLYLYGTIEYQFKQLCLQYAPAFGAQGWRVDFLIEMGPPGWYESGQPRCYVAHFWQEQETA